MHIAWDGDAPTGEADLRIRAWGPGADWLVAQVPAMSGEHDPGHYFHSAHPVLERAQLNHPRMRMGASGVLYHELLPTVLGQRVTAGEALGQWRRLVHHLGSPAPGPCDGLFLPPQPEVLAGQPAWWFHPLGIEAKRAEALREVARHPRKLFEWARLSPTEAAAKLGLAARNRPMDRRVGVGHCARGPRFGCRRRLPPQEPRRACLHRSRQGNRRRDARPACALRRPEGQGRAPAPTRRTQPTGLRPAPPCAPHGPLVNDDRVLASNRPARPIHLR